MTLSQKTECANEGPSRTAVETARCAVLEGPQKGHERPNHVHVADSGFEEADWFACTHNERVEKVDVADEMSKSFLDYSMSVIISRALPDARDGLKPSQRRILYAMHELSLYPPRKHMKCAKICGDTSGNYHPHGEAVIYPTLVHMAQHWAMRETLVDPQGNFGSVEGDPPAAMRYTEARFTLAWRNSSR